MIRWYFWSDDIDDLQATEKTILESLPTRKQAIIAVATAKVGHDDHDGKMLLIISKLSLIWFISSIRSSSGYHGQIEIRAQQPTF